MHATLLTLALLVPAEYPPYYGGYNGGRGEVEGRFVGPRGSDVEFRGSYDRYTRPDLRYDPYIGMEPLEYSAGRGRFELESFYRRTPGGGLELVRLVLRRADDGGYQPYPRPRPMPYPYVERGPSYGGYPGAPPPRVRESRTPTPAPFSNGGPAKGPN